MIACSECSAPLPETARFCLKCGHKVETLGAAIPSEAPPPIVPQAPPALPPQVTPPVLLTEEDHASSLRYPQPGGSWAIYPQAWKVVGVSPLGWLGVIVVGGLSYLLFNIITSFFLGKIPVIGGVFALLANMGFMGVLMAGGFRCALDAFDVGEPPTISKMFSGFASIGKYLVVVLGTMGPWILLAIVLFGLVYFFAGNMIQTAGSFQHQPGMGQGFGSGAGAQGWNPPPGMGRGGGMPPNFGGMRGGGNLTPQMIMMMQTLGRWVLISLPLMFVVWALTTGLSLAYGFLADHPEYSATQALSEAWKLTKSHFGALCGFSLLHAFLGIVMGILTSWGLGLFIGVFMSSLARTGGMGAFFILLQASVILTSLVLYYVFFLPYIISMALLYRDLRYRLSM